MRTLLYLLLLLPAIALAQQSDPQLTAQMNRQMAKRNTAVFEENKGQMKDQHWQPRPDVLFNGSAQGMHYYIRDNGMSYQLNRVESWKEEEDDRRAMVGTEKRQVPDEMGTYRVDVEWTDFNADFTVEKGVALDSYTNYYNVPEGVEPALFVKQYESVTLKGLWPGIDLRCYSTDGTLETDWLVAPGADYSQIRFEVKGAELSTDDAGHLIMSTPFGEIREGGLKVFQEGRQLEARWVIAPLEGEVSGGVVSFEVKGHDPMLAMRIDPVVRVWGTYYGGENDDIGFSVSTDNVGNVCVGGYTYSAVNIASGGHQNTYVGGPDAFLVKFNNNGVRQWATYYGGNSVDYGQASAADGSGNVYLAGETVSDNSIAWDGHQMTFVGGNGHPDAFLVKFNVNGIRLWATYYGGSLHDQGWGCATDGNGNVYLSGSTNSTTSIASNGHDSIYSGSGDAFLVKFNSLGVRQWGTYYGGGGGEFWYQSCATDGSGNVYLAGNTDSSTLIASGGHQNTIGSVGSYDAFLVKFNDSGVRLWGTYYGGSLGESGHSCSTDSQGNVFLSGATGSDNGIAFNGHQNTNNGGGEAFLVKFDGSGIRQWGTYFGGSGNESGVPLATATDGSGNIYLAGVTTSTTDIAFGGFQNSYADSTDVFLVKFNGNGIREWGTYYGGIGAESYHFSCAADSSGNVYITGMTESSTAIASNGHQVSLASGHDAFLVKFKPASVYGSIWLDLNGDCVKDDTEQGTINGVPLTIQPGNLVTQSENGIWYVDSLPTGTYTVSVDTTNPNWIFTCPASQTFTVVNPQELTEGPSFGMISTNPCPLPDVSIVMPQMRRGFSDQMIYVSACNEATATDVSEGAYCIIELDENISVQSASVPYSELGDNLFQFDLGDMNPGQCVNFMLSATVLGSAVANQTLCLSAELYPQLDCIFDTIPDPFPPTVSPCIGDWDGSSLSVVGYCDSDTVRFIIKNNGQDMVCQSPVSVYLDGQQVALDSVLLNGGDSAMYAFVGLAQTWTVNALQHPEHPGSSSPIASVENCGAGNWTPGIIGQFPQDDADPIIDVFCDQVSAPYDPNDKTGFPLGLGETHALKQNQQIEYLVRFQNIGTDTAVNVVILDTLTTDLNIFTVESGVSSHPYEFRMYGPRVLEWKFSNIMLPDSTTDEPGSNGFVLFKVRQVADLPFGTVIENTANIYFDFEEPVITNTYFHTVTDFSGTLFPEPQVGIFTSDTGLLCETASIMLTATYGDSYLWSTGETTQSIEVTEEGQYSVTVTYYGGFVSTAGPLAINENPAVTYTELPDTVSLYASAISLTGWPEGGTFTGQGVIGNVFNPIEAGIGQHCITYTYSDEFGCSGLMTQCVVVDLFAGIGELDGVICTVFPNPSNSIFNLVMKNASGDVHIIVTDNMGREVLMENFSATGNSVRSIDMSGRASGIYFLRVQTDDGAGVVKLVKE